MTSISGSLTTVPNRAAGSAAGLLWWARQAVIRAVRRQQTRRALSQLSERALQDIGLRRGEINSIARSVAEDRPDVTRIAPRLNDLCL